MARLARVVIPGIPHHVIQRGNRRQNVFFCEEDRVAYRIFLRNNCLISKLKIIAYCLMQNHIHLIVIPEDEKGLSKGIGDTHREYSRMINFREKWRGYLFQGRFLSYPMEEKHLFEAVRYVENNPVKAGMVPFAEDYRWSSASSHIDKKDDILMRENRDYVASIFEIDNWQGYLRERIELEEERRIDYHMKTGWPLGDSECISRWEGLLGRKLRKAKPGPKVSN